MSSGPVTVRVYNTYSVAVTISDDGQIINGGAEATVNVTDYVNRLLAAGVLITRGPVVGDPVSGIVWRTRFERFGPGSGTPIVVEGIPDLYVDADDRLIYRPTTAETSFPIATATGPVGGSGGGGGGPTNAVTSPEPFRVVVLSGEEADVDTATLTVGDWVADFRASSDGGV